MAHCGVEKTLQDIIANYWYPSLQKSCELLRQLFKSTSSKEIIKHFTSLLDIFDNPDKIVSNRETAFASHEFSKFVRVYNIKHHQVSIAAPWVNGLVKRVNRFLKSSLRKLVDEFAWNVCLPTLQYVINNTFHTFIKNSTSKELLGYDQRNQGDQDASLVEHFNHIVKVEFNFELERDATCELA